jgi:hypothetical protein
MLQITRRKKCAVMEMGTENGKQENATSIGKLKRKQVLRESVCSFPNGGSRNQNNSTRRMNTD